ncbi:MAG: substrate-binding domain-containing protein [Bifidobacteriaceae bacterium]|jgi:ABC-type xylose transport system substrate-binding protein|nr:substrate-binding domain-containing protein [Bifidobacteriaceae bacterium]
MNKKILSFSIPLILIGIITGSLYLFVFHKTFTPETPQKQNNLKIGVIMPSSWFSFVDNSTIDYPQHIKDTFFQTLTAAGLNSQNIYIESATTLGDQAEKVKIFSKNSVQAIIISPVMDENVLPDLLGLTIPNPYAMGKDTSFEQQELKISLNEAQKSGIKLIGWQNYIAGIKYDLFIQSPTAKLMGQKTGEWINQYNETNNSDSANNMDKNNKQNNSTNLKKTMEIILPEITENNYSKDFFSGFYDTVKTKIKNNLYFSIDNKLNPNTLPDQFSQFCLKRNNGKPITTAADEQSEAYKYMTKILVNQYKLNTLYNFNPEKRPDIIISGSDQIAQGVINALKDKGFAPSYDSSRWPTIIGVGGLKTSIWNISNSFQSMTIVYDSNLLVKNTTEAIKNMLTNPQEIEKQLKLYSHLDINGFQTAVISTDPIAIDKTNEKSELLDKGYITPGEAGL